LKCFFSTQEPKDGAASGHKPEAGSGGIPKPEVGNGTASHITSADIALARQILGFLQLLQIYKFANYFSS